MERFQFLEKDFKILELNDQQKLEPFLNKYPHALSGYTFASLFSWHPIYHYAFHFLEEETLLISFETEKKRHLLEPIGLFSLAAQQILLSAIQKTATEIRVVSESFLKKNPFFCNFFKQQNNRDYANYIYRAKDLANLTGRHYEKKRNLIAQAEKLYEWNIESLTKKCHSYCPKILEEIGNFNSEKLQDELKALDQILLHFEVLNLKGIVISIEGKPEAFSIYGKLNSTSAGVYFEKANRQFKGLYQMINREAAKAILKDGFSLINREEDLGIEGLRQAKMSYFPLEITPCYSLIHLK